MPRTIAPNEVPPPPDAAPNRIRWTVQQCDAIREAGVLTGRYELIDGEIISKMGQKPPHAFAITAINTWLALLFGGDLVRIQLTVSIDGSGAAYDEPEPDAVVTTQPNSAYAARHPGPNDVELIVEVSDTTLRFDRSAKALLYARIGIRDYWVVDIQGRQVFVHRQPINGTYSEVKSFGPDELISPLARPDAIKRIDELLPPKTS